MGFPLIQADVLRYGEDWIRWAHENNRALEVHLVRMDARMVKVTASGTIDPSLLPPPLPALVTAWDAGQLTPTGGATDTFRFPAFNTLGTVIGASVTAFGFSLINDQDAATARTTLGLVIGTNVQAFDQTLQALAGANWSANAIPIGSGADTVSQVTFAANTFPGRSSTGNLVAKTMTDFGFSLVDDANAAAARTTLGLVIGTDVQAFDATLQALAGTNWATNSVAVGTGVNTATQVALTANTLLANDSGGTVFASPVSDVSLANLFPQASIPAWRSALGGTTVGQAFFTLANPSAIRFPRINADNSVTAQTAANFVTDIGLEANANYVHIAGTETITGTKTFSASVTTNGIFQTDTSSIQGRLQSNAGDSRVYCGSVTSHDFGLLRAGVVIAIVGSTGVAVTGLVSATTTIGYATGAGGTATQATNKATGVTINKACGEITMNGAALAADTTVSFVLTNSTIAATDVLVINHRSVGTFGAYTFNARCAAGSATIDVRNVTAGSLSEAIVIRFALIKGVNT